MFTEGGLICIIVPSPCLGKGKQCFYWFFLLHNLRRQQIHLPAWHRLHLNAEPIFCGCHLKLYGFIHSFRLNSLSSIALHLYSNRIVKGQGYCRFQPWSEQHSILHMFTEAGLICAMIPSPCLGKGKQCFYWLCFFHNLYHHIQYPQWQLAVISCLNTESISRRYRDKIYPCSGICDFLSISA